MFCEIVAGERSAHVVYESPATISFLDQFRQPADPAHVLVIPRTHVENIHAVQDDLGSELFSAHALIARAIKRAFSPDGITTWSSNERGASQEVPHFHLHVYPRRVGVPFPPVISFPESPVSDDLLAPSAVRLRAAVEELRSKPDARLSQVAERLSRLVLEVPRLRDLLDLLAGALASLIQARHVGYEDRLEALPDDYYPKLSKRVARMAAGTLPPHGRWISGYYFNSGLMRLHACLDQFERIQEAISGQRLGGLRAGAVEALRTDVNRLKHQRTGVAAEPRNLTYDEATWLLAEVISQIETHKQLLNDPAVEVPEMRYAPRRRLDLGP